MSMEKGFPRTSIPANMSKAEKAEKARIPQGPGNNVNSMGNGVNVNDQKAGLKLDRQAQVRAREYAGQREEIAYKLARAEKKRARQKKRQYVGNLRMNQTTLQTKLI